ncbi:MAG: cysteine--tRNA ligase, partial [Patescibacteria group bacterium]
MGLFSFLRFFSFASPRPARADLPPLRVFNTLSGTTEKFSPQGGRVTMYNCGPTVYDRQHIGNLRPYVFADTLRRTLEAWGHGVIQVINITDVGHLTSDADEGEDKVEESAKRRGVRAQDVATEVTDWWFADLDLLGIDRKKIEFPRATEYIDEIIAYVKSLEQKGYAYRTADGVYFDTAKFPDYGKLGHLDLMGQRPGARVEENLEKKNPHDFALWKLSKEGAGREQEWQSPWGVGFPGWHIECTAMIFKLLGKQIDIHTGGVDHIPVHHNNEIAQAEVLTHKQYVRYWMHNEFITIEGKKVSKSLGNTIYLYQITDRGYSPRSLRYLFLTAHYRSPMNFTWAAVESADTALGKLNRMYLELPPSGLPPEDSFAKDFYAALADDLDTPLAIARLWEALRDQRLSPAVKRSCLALADAMLGLGLSEP